MPATNAPPSHTLPGPLADKFGKIKESKSPTKKILPKVKAKKKASKSKGGARERGERGGSMFQRGGAGEERH